MNDKINVLINFIFELKNSKDPNFIIKSEKKIIEQMESLKKSITLKEKYSKNDLNALLEALNSLFKNQPKSAKIFEDFKIFLEKK